MSFERMNEAFVGPYGETRDREHTQELIRLLEANGIMSAFPGK